MVLASRLVLPYFEFEGSNGLGEAVLYAIRNESTNSIQVDIQYYEIDSPIAPQRTDRVTLGPKQIKPVNLRDVANLEVDPDQRTRGYATFTVVGGADVLAGDYFRVDPDDNYASGMRLVIADPGSAHDERCSIFTTRFLRGGAFTGGTRIFYWLDSTVLPTNPSTITYAIYDETGNLLRVGELPSPDRVAGQFQIEQILGGLSVTAGALEIQFSGGVKGHVAASMSASGRFSVGLEAVCRE
jgi:hypothetical protein